MKTFIKRALTVLLVAVMLISAAPLGGIADLFDFSIEASAVEHSGACGDNLTWKLDTETGVLDVFGTGAMHNYDFFNRADWLYYKKKIKSVVIGNGVTSIGSEAFYDCDNLTNVTIGSGVVTIEVAAFAYCDNLIDINIPDSVVSINQSAFEDTSYFKNIDNWIDGVLYIDNHLILADDSLNGCYTIKDNTKTISDAAFSGCDNLTGVSMPNSVIAIGEMAFYSCNNLTSVIIPDGVTAIDNEVFRSCSNLTSVTIPDSVTTIGSSAFSGCSSLTSVTIPDSVTTIGDYAFHNCYNLTSVIIGNSVITIGTSSFEGCRELTSVTIGNSVMTIGNESFGDCDELTSVKIPDSVQTIGESAFEGCTDLSTVTIGNSVTSIGNSAFRGCDLTSVTIPDSVTTIGNFAFYNCTSLTNVTIGDGVTIIGNLAFSKCAANITVDADNQYYSSDSYGVLYNKNKTELIQYPEGNERTSFAIPDSVTTIGDSAFYDCSLTSVTIPDSVTTIGDSAFYGCSLTSVIIPDGVTTIGKWTFDNCDSLTSVTIPASVTTVENSAFFFCFELTDVYYSGSESDWNNISIGSSNDDLLNATIHFNSTGGGSGGNSDTDSSGYLYHLYAFSSKPQLIMGTVDAIELTFEIDCYDWENPAYLLTSPTFSFTTSDTNIFSIEKIENRDGRTYVTITGENPGTAFLVVTGYNNGKYVAGGRYMVTVTGESVYHADAIPKFDDYNIIANNIIIDNYKCTNTGTETCNISFDAYNMLNCFGSVELYDSNNNLLESYCIDRFGLGLPTGLWDSIKQAYDVTDLKDLSYKNEDYSAKTKIELIAVPRDGHIVISNDPSASVMCAAYNLSYLVADICCAAVSLAMPSGSADEVSDNIAKAIAKETIESLFGNEELLERFESFTKDFLTGANCGSRESIDKNVKYYSVFISEIGVDIGDIAIDIFKESLKDLPGNLIETAVYSVLGVTGTFMETGFKFISFADTKDMIETLSENYGVGNTSIYCSKPWEEQLYSNGYMVTNRELFDENVSFHQYKIVDDDTYDKATNTFGDERYIDIIEMSLYKNGVKQQPQGDVEVAMPLPKGMSFMDVEVYRMEEDGSYTEIPCWVEDGYIYIKTNHFSVYCIVGEKIEIEDMSFEEDYVRLNLNDSHTNNLVIYPVESVNAELEWSSSDESIAVVTPMGNVVGINPGTVVIYASTKDGKHTASYTLEVVASISMYLNTSNISMNYKSSTTLAPSIDVDAGVEYTVEYFSSDPSVATVDENGKVTATGTGSADITVTVTDKNGNTVSDTCEVTVEYSWWQWIIVIVLFGWIWY